MAEFSKCIKKILEHEGGWVNNPADPGGATNFGVSLNFLKDHKEGDFNKDGKVDVRDIRNMTVQQAMMIYKVFWWDKYHYGDIIDNTIALKVFDFSVNMGGKRAHTLCQTALNRAYDLELDEDGVLGRTTIHMLNVIKDGQDEQYFLTTFSDVAWEYYQSLVARNPKLKVFLKGWKNRAYSISKANQIT